MEVKYRLIPEPYYFYPEAFKGDTRTVYLVGEANFKVKKDPEKPFIVRSGKHGCYRLWGQSLMWVLIRKVMKLLQHYFMGR